jgi:Esterase/lipase
MMQENDWGIGAEAFFLEGTSNVAVLMLHGLTASAAEMRLLGDFLHARGYTVWAPLLPGHGTSPEDLQEKTYQDFIRSALEGYDRLKECRGVEKVHIVGQSMGGLLALYLAEKGLGDKIVVLAAPVWIHQSLGEFSRILHHVKPYTERRKKPFRFDGRLIYPGYSKMPLKTVASTWELRKEVLEKLADITQPLLLIYSDTEHTVKPESADFIEKNAVNSKVRQIRLNDSGHTITLDKQREKAFQEILEFFENN